MTLENGVGMLWWSLVFLLKATELLGDSDALNNVTTIMLSLLRHHPVSRTLADESTLDTLLILLSQTENTRDLDDEGIEITSSVHMHCNIIAMLGVLCSEPHPTSVNDRVCSALTEKMKFASGQNQHTKQTVLVLNEVYNVLMDIYGADDANDDIYQKQDVSGHLTRTLPVFKRNIKKVAAMERDNEELGVWNETSLNVSRFIRFKRES
jgi:hypothetical protein